MLDAVGEDRWGTIDMLITTDEQCKEFENHGIEMAGPAAELMQTSGRWSSNCQRDMMRKCTAYKAGWFPYLYYYIINLCTKNIWSLALLPSLLGAHQQDCGADARER